MSRELDLVRRIAARHVLSHNNDERVLYFAYGHNMDVDALRKVAPSALDLGAAKLRDHRIVFDAVSHEDTQTWATLELAAGAETWGVVFAIEKAEMAALDAAEAGYARVHVPVETFDGRILAGEVYTAAQRAPHAAPSGWYVLGVLREAGRRGFPQSYLESVEIAAGGARVLGSRTASTGYFQVGEEILFGKYKNKRGRILRFYIDDRGVPMVEIEPIPKGRKKNREMGLYNFWHLPERRHPPKKTAMDRTACIIAGRKFGDRLCLLKNRDRAYDADLAIVHLEKEGTEIAVIYDLVTGYMEGVNEYGIGIVNTTLMVLRDEAEGKTQGKGKKGDPMRSKDGPKIVRALAKRTLEDAVQSLTYDGGGIRGHTFVADGKRIVSIECSRKHPALVTTLDPERINTRTNHGVSYPDAGYTHGPDYVSSIVRRWEAQKRLQTIRRPEAAAVALVEVIDEADSPFNPVRVTDHMRTTSQLTIDTTNPALFLYLIPGHAEVKKTRNLLPGERKPKIPVRVFRYKHKMEDRKPPDSVEKTAKRELLDVTAIEKLRKDFLTLMKNAGVVKDYAQAMVWREAVQVWNNRFNHIVFEQLAQREFKELARANIITQSDADYWMKKIGKECWPLYIEFRVPILKANPSDGFYGTEDYAFAKMMKELPKWKGRVERAARQAWAALKDMVTWFANHRQHPMTVDVLTVENESMEGFQVALRGASDDAYDAKGSVERFKEGLRLYKQRARLVLPLLLQAQLPLVLDFKMGLDAGGRYYGQYIGISALETIGRPERLSQVLAHEMGHHLYDTYLSGEDRKFWNAAITGNYGKLDLHDVLRRYGSEKDFILNDRIRQEDPILYLQIEGLHADPSSERVFQSMWKMDDLREYLAEGGQAVWTVHGKPITGYANKNNEEAFCEAIGMLVGYGPRAVLPEVREWLKTILPSLKVAFERIAKARYKSKKKVKTQDGDEMVVYEYGPRQVANRNKEKAERVEKLRGSISKLRKKVNSDLTSKDEHVAAVALAVGLMDETYERVGNDASAEDGHFGVTTWQVQHVKFNGGKATVSYVGKSGVKQKKTVSTAALVKALRSACKGKGKDACMLDVSASDVNEYLKPFEITAKDLRGFHANREMSDRLKVMRKKGPKLPAGRKEKDEILKKEFKAALAETAKAVGHTESTLRSQYLVPGLEDDYMKDGTVSNSLVKKSSVPSLRPTGESAIGDGRIFTMPLRDDTFIHFTPSDRALEILKSKKLLMDPPYKKFGIDAVNAISTTYGKFVPGVQTTHIKDNNIVGILFSTNTVPTRGYVEEVVWKQDVTLNNPKLLPLSRAVAMLNASPTKLGDQDMVVYNKPVKIAASLRTAALAGTPTERRILSASVLAPVLVSRSRQWWITNAPNLYRIAREFEQPRPIIDGLRFPPEMFSMLWYEDEEGNRLPDRSEAEQMDGSFVPDGSHTQHSQFPTELRHNILVMNEDGTSSSLGSMSSTYSSDLLTAMIRSGEWDAADAIQVAGQSCERCMNVLYDRYGLEDGYPFGSDAYWRCGTRCTMCEHLVGDPREEDANAAARARIERISTKSPAEVEDEKVQEMLRPEPKKKPPRYDLRDNRTLDEEDDDLKGTGGGDDGDRDLSLKWNKVAHRVAFRWLAIPTSLSAQRVALHRVAKATDKSEFQKEMEGKPFRHPDTGNEVEFDSLPSEEQRRLYDRWKSDREEEEGDAEELKDEDLEEIEDDTEELDEDDVEEVDETDPDELDPPEDLFDGLGEDAPSEEDEDTDDAPAEEKPAEDKPAEEAKKPEPAKPKEKGKRNKEDIEQELEEARDRVEDLEAAIVKAKRDIKEGKEEIAEISKLLEKASPQNKVNIQSKIKEVKRKMHSAEDLIDDHQEELKQTQQKVKKLKKERKAPQEAEQKREDNETKSDQKERSRKLVQETRGALQNLVGKDSEVPKELQRQIEDAVSGLDEEQVEDFSAAFQGRMGDLVNLDPLSEGALSIANRASRLQDVSGIDDPERLAEQLAENAYTNQVVANPMIVAGKPVGGRKMDPKAYGERASEAFNQFKGLHKHLRQFAGERIAQALKGLDEDDDKAKELNAILSGINAAHVADTGEALEGRPQPSKGHAALVKKLVETGNAEQMFKPLEDFFADDSRAAMSEALREMDDGDVADFITGGDSGHPWSKLTEMMKSPGASEYKQMLKDFLIQDFLNDTWGDRAARDVMEAAGIAGADSPEARAKILGEAKSKGTGSVAAALEAMERVSEAARRGETPDPEDDALVRGTFDGEASVGLVDSARSLLNTLKSKFKKHVVSPAVAVLNHFVTKRDPQVLGQETLPHPDEAEPQARDVSEEGDDDHKAGEVWKTEAGNWRAKNKNGAPKTFKDQAKAKTYAEGKHDVEKSQDDEDDFSGEFKIDVEDRGPSKFANGLAESWLERVRKTHPDASNRPLVVFEAA